MGELLCTHFLSLQYAHQMPVYSLSQLHNSSVILSKLLFFIYLASRIFRSRSSFQVLKLLFTLILKASPKNLVLIHLSVFCLNFTFINLLTEIFVPTKCHGSFRSRKTCTHCWIPPENFPYVLILTSFSRAPTLNGYSHKSPIDLSVNVSFKSLINCEIWPPGNSILNEFP